VNWFHEIVHGRQHGLTRGSMKSSCTANTEHASAQYYRDVLELVLRRLGPAWVEERGRPSARAHIVWWDEPIRRPHLLALPAGARINRCYAMVRLCRKVCLARLLHVAARLYPEEYRGLAPDTWWVGQPSWAAQLRAHRLHCSSEAASGTHAAAVAAGGAAGGSAAPTAAASPAFIVKPDNGCQVPA